MGTAVRGLWIVPQNSSTVQYGANQVGYGTARDATAVAQMQRMGCTTMRIGWDWSALQPTSLLSSIFWSGPDAVMAAVPAGMSVTFSYYNSPGWANGSLASNGIPTEGSSNDSVWQAYFAAFVGAFAARYAGKGIIHEIWNEPNTNYVGSFWAPNGSSSATPSPTQYLSLFKTGSVAIKAADPLATVSTGGLAALTYWSGSGGTPGLAYLTTLMKAGISADMISIHPYTSSGVYDPTVDSYPTGNSFKDIGRIQSAMRTYGYGGTRLRVGEFGNYSAATAGSEAKKATYLRAALTLINTTYGINALGAGQAGVTHITYFSLNNATNGSTDITDIGLWSGTPLVGPNTILASGAAFQSFTAGL